MATFVNDTFTGTDGTELSAHAGETGATWTRDFSTGQWRIATNRAYAFTPSWYLASGVPATADYYVEAVLHTGDLTGTGGGGALRVRSFGGNGYTFCFRKVANAVDIRRATGGAETVISTQPTFTWAANTDYTVRFTATGTTLTGTIDTVDVVTVTDATYAGAGSAGVLSQGSNDPAKDFTFASFQAIDGSPGAGIPTVTSLTPDHGSSSGLNSVVIAGTGFGTANAVSFGGVASPSWSVTSGTTQITAIAPPGVPSSTVSVTVSNATGSSANTAGDDYDYDAPASDWGPGNISIKE